MVFSIVRFMLVFIEIVSALLLVSVILIQRTKSQGMGLAFGSGMGESLFGAQVGNVLTRATAVIGIVFLLNTTVLALMQSGKREGSVTERVAVAPAPVPQLPAGAPAPSSELPPMDFSTSQPEMPAATLDAEMGGDVSVDVDTPMAAAPAAPAAEVPAAAIPDVPVDVVPADTAPAGE